MTQNLIICFGPKQNTRTFYFPKFRPKNTFLAKFGPELDSALCKMKLDTKGIQGC